MLPPMSRFQRNDTVIHYEERGEGFPILTFAPGGMRSAIDFWGKSPWNPIDVLSDRFRVISLDQRNAGRSRAPVGPHDGWHSYTADHIALLDHLGIERCHLLGGCIGGSYCLGVMKAAPGRVAAAVLQQPIGLDDNRDAFYAMFDSWSDEIAPKHPEANAAAWRSFRSNMYDGDFVFNVDRAFVRACPTPMLVLMGADLYHPTSTSREIAELAGNAELVERWKEDDVISQTTEHVRDFLLRHTPGDG